MYAVIKMTVYIICNFVKIMIHISSFIFCDPGGTRTLDPSIKSAVLYLLSYEVILSKNYLFVLTSAKLRIIFQTTKCFTNFFLFPM